MAIDYTLTVKKIHSLEKIYVLFSASTRMPFVECDPEEFDDQIYIFANEELATAAAKAYAEKQMPTGGEEPVFGIFRKPALDRRKHAGI